MLGDLKVIDPLCSEEAKVGLLGGSVAFGNTRPAVRLKMFGHLQRGQIGDGSFNPTTGTGYVTPVPGDYAGALENGAHVVAMLFETFGGFSPDFLGLLKQAAAAVDNRLSSTQYDDATWSTRSWMSTLTPPDFKLHICSASSLDQSLTI